MAELDQPTEPSTPIRTPLKLQIRRLRYQVLPVLIFAIALVLTAYLWKNYTGAPHGYGEVNAMTVRISAPKDGMLAENSSYPRLFDRVEKGQLLARFSASDRIEQQSQIEEEMTKKRAELTAVQEQLEAATKAGADKAKLDPLKQQVSTLTAVVEEELKKFNHLNKQIEAANLVAPVAGTLTHIAHQPGEFVKQGQEIMTITQETGSYITSYVRVGAGIVPRKDMWVTVRGQDSRRSGIALVQEVGSQVEQIPEHQLANPKRPEWGVPVRIAMPVDLPLRPGELVGLNYIN